MPKTLTQIYNLNLSEKYVSNWGGWEIVREILCNAIDADPTGYHIRTEGPDIIKIFSNTVPQLKQLLIMGEGSKTAEDDNIGQFGEGFKLAALRAVILGNIEVYCDDYQLKFFLQDVLGSKCLHVSQEMALIPIIGFEVVIKIPGVANTLIGKLLDIKTPHYFDKEDPNVFAVFSKGVKISSLLYDSVYSWNLDSLELNRDRSLVAIESVINAIALYIDNNPDEDLLREILTKRGSIEFLALKYSSNAHTSCKRILRDLYGPKLCYSHYSAEADITSAKAQGYHVFDVINSNYTTYISLGIIPVGSIPPVDLTKQVIKTEHPFLDNLQSILRVADIEYRLAVIPKEHPRVVRDGSPRTLYIPEKLLTSTWEDFILAISSEFTIRDGNKMMLCIHKLRIANKL